MKVFSGLVYKGCLDVQTAPVTICLTTCVPVLCDTSISIASTMFQYQYQRGLDISRYHNTAKYHDDTGFDTVQNRSIVDNYCTLRDSNEKSTSH